MRFLKNNILAKLKIAINQVYPLKAKSYKLCNSLISNKIGLEIGGPSSLFSNKGILPIYKQIKSLDNCNFSSQTIWEGSINEGYTFKFDKDKPNGYQYLLEATSLKEIESEKYDFILSSHVIEHIANPIKALYDWIRVVKDNGIFIIILPHKDGAFDHKRVVTSFKHIIADYENNTQENDLTHLEEILTFHDLTRDPKAGSFDQFKERSLNNFENRCLHHHVFDAELARRLIEYVKLNILDVEEIFHNIVIIAKKQKSN